MNFQTISRASVLALATAGFAAAQNDECTGAIALTLNTAVAFDTTTGTLSAPAWPCAAVSTAPDLWYSFTAANANGFIVNTCGSGYDTALEIFTGNCAGLTSVACNDDSCALQSSITVPTATAGTTYYIRVGGFAAASGAGTVVVNDIPPPPCFTALCAQTTFANNNQGGVGGNVYFNITVNANITISGLETNFAAAAGTPVGMLVWTTPTTYVGNTANAAAWTQVAMDNGAAIAAGIGQPTAIQFAAPLNLAPGTYGIALQAVGSGHAYTNGNGTNQAAGSCNGNFVLTLGAATNTPFAAGNPFSPRVWNGTLCEGGSSTPGTNYCGPAVANSTGNSAEMSASGTATVANNNLVLEASSMPNNAFGFFLTSRTQGLVPQPGGSQGVLCLGGAIGRYVGAGQIKNSGATGSFDLALDLTQTPTPTGLVSVAAGETWNFQCWYRDAVGGVATSNFTDGLSVLFN